MIEMYEKGKKPETKRDWEFVLRLSGDEHRVFMEMFNLAPGYLVKNLDLDSQDIYVVEVIQSIISTTLQNAQNEYQRSKPGFPKQT